MAFKPESIKGATKCPHCGSEEGIVSSRMEAWKKDGTLPKNTQLQGIQIQAIFADPVRAQMLTEIAAPVILARLEICAKCFAVYCPQVNTGLAIGKTQMQQAPASGVKMPALGMAGA